MVIGRFNSICVGRGHLPVGEDDVAISYLSVEQNEEIVSIGRLDRRLPVNAGRIVFLRA